MRFWKTRTVSGTPTLGVGVAAYLNHDPRLGRALEGMVASFRAQTYPKWQMRIIHDGPADAAALQALEGVAKSDTRVQFQATKDRKEQHGHPYRQRALLALIEQGCTWLLSTNQDAYYAPTFVEWLLSMTSVTAKPSRSPQLVYCNCVHSHKLWQPMDTRPRRKHIDMGGFLVAAELVRQIPFDKVSFAADGDWIERLARAAGARIAKVPATLYVHN